jgi:dephospho-CoA kinase
MGAWPGKYVIGLTGNIATGKSVVRKMLEHLGAYGIDADALGHRAIAKDAPGYKPVLDHFGKWVLGADEQIDRAKLGRMVFSDPEALKALENIVHPFVRQATDVLIRRSTQPVIVIEAIKLLESPIRQGCDAIWVAHASPEAQLARLMQKRGLAEDAARQRIAAQPAQDAKLAAANVVIRNDGSFEETWKQVVAAWPEKSTTSFETAPTRPLTATHEDLIIERARPRQAGEIAALITRLSQGKRKLSANDIMEAFGEKAYLLLRAGAQAPSSGVVGWQVENLVARIDDMYLDASVPQDKALKALMEEVELASKDLQCEAALLFIPAALAKHGEIWRALGYEARTPQSLGVRAWQEAAQESQPTDTALLFKQLRKDRVLRPV